MIQGCMSASTIAEHLPEKIVQPTGMSSFTVVKSLKLSQYSRDEDAAVRVTTVRVFMSVSAEVS
jgi:hypothetical protein